MAKKEFAFRGKSLEELKAMPKEEFSKLLNSRVRRSFERQDNSHILKKLAKAQAIQDTGKYPKPIRTHKRDLVIIPQMIGLEMAIYTGKEFLKVPIQSEMMGHIVGEVAMTRKRIKHGKAGIGATRSSTAQAKK